MLICNHTLRKLPPLKDAETRVYRFGGIHNLSRSSRDCRGIRFVLARWEEGKRFEQNMPRCRPKSKGIHFFQLADLMILQYIYIYSPHYSKPLIQTHLQELWGWFWCLAYFVGILSVLICNHTLRKLPPLKDAETRVYRFGGIHNLSRSSRDCRGIRFVLARWEEGKRFEQNMPRCRPKSKGIHFFQLADLMILQYIYI